MANHFMEKLRHVRSSEWFTPKWHVVHHLFHGENIDNTVNLIKLRHMLAVA